MRVQRRVVWNPMDASPLQACYSVDDTMLRRFFKRHLPNAESVESNRFLRIFGPLLRKPKLWQLHRKGVATGVAIGLVTGLFPGPIQMLGSAILALLLRANLPVALLTTFYTNPFTFIPLYMLAYKIGALVTGGNSEVIPPMDFQWNWAHIKSMVPDTLTWLSSLGHTLVVGLAIQCALFATVGYFAVMIAWRCWVIRQWRARPHARRAAAG